MRSFDEFAIRVGNDDGERNGNASRDKCFAAPHANVMGARMDESAGS
jgi:hypothetical protein